MTEDIEFTSICAINNIKVDWAPKAITFDEQPITFKQSWNQRKRWSTGILQCLYRYTIPLFIAGIKLKKFRCIDTMLLLWAPLFQLLSLVSFVLILILTAFGSRYDLFPQTDVYFRMFVSFDGSVISGAILSLLVVLLEKKDVRKMFKGIITTWGFVASWIPINIICLFHRSDKWEEIERRFREDKLALARYNVKDAQLVLDIFEKTKHQRYLEWLEAERIRQEYAARMRQEAIERQNMGGYI